MPFLFADADAEASQKYGTLSEKYAKTKTDKKTLIYSVIAVSVILIVVIAGICLYVIRGCFLKKEEIEDANNINIRFR